MSLKTLTAWPRIDVSMPTGEAQAMNLPQRIRGVTAKILAIELAAFAAATLIAAAIFIIDRNAAVERELVDDLTRSAAVLAVPLRGEMGDLLAQLQDDGDLQSPAWTRWRDLLAEFRRALVRSDSVLAMRWDPRLQEPVVVARSEDAPAGHAGPWIGAPVTIDDPKEREEFAAALQRGEPTGTPLMTALTGEGRAHYSLIPVRDSQGQLAGAIVVAIASSFHYAILAEILRTFFIYAGIILLMMIALTLPLSYTLTRPLARLVVATEALGRGDFGAAVNVRTGDEIGLLARTFEKMREDLQRAQRQALDNMRLSTVGRMASGIIHDFKSPMTAISGFAELMIMPDFPEEQREEFRRSIQKNIDMMVEMTQDLLDYSRGEARLNARPVHVPSFVQEITETCEGACREARIRLIPENTCDAEATVDEVKLRRVVLNLITNAREAMGPGGEIRFISRVEDGVWHLEVRDTGPGIPDEIMDRLFEPFATHGKATGTGLGLALAKQFVEQHGGCITVQSQRGRGTTFFIEIPFSSRELEQAA
jgi:signal transduction histidine kinase